MRRSRRGRGEKERERERETTTRYSSATSLLLRHNGWGLRVSLLLAILIPNFSRITEIHQHDDANGSVSVSVCWLRSQAVVFFSSFTVLWQKNLC